MKIEVISHPRSKQEKIELISPGQLEIWVTQPAIDNKANKAIIEMLSDYLKLPKSHIRLASGIKSKKKLFEIY